MKGIPGTITPEGKYVENQVIACYQTDAGKKLRPAAFMDIAQEIAFRAANVMGFGYDNLIRTSHAWVLSRLHFRYSGLVSWRDEITLSTWNRGPFGPFYLRDFRLEGENGSILATSSWVVLDLQARAMTRHLDLFDEIPPQYQCSEAVLEEPAPKVIIPRDTLPEFAGIHRVSYSDIDMLGHTNNARYMVWAMECLPDELASEKCPKDVYINFIHETKLDDDVTLWRVDKDSGIYILGKIGEENAFTVRLDY